MGSEPLERYTVERVLHGGKGNSKKLSESQTGVGVAGLSRLALVKKSDKG